MNLHTQKDAFKELTELTADYFSYESSHVEKDYWVSKILKEISGSEYNGQSYFKGGTSLSKAYNLIRRFSEDLDLFVFTGDTKSSKSAEKRLLKNLADFITGNNGDIYDEENSKAGGNFRKLSFAYDREFENTGLKDNVEVEIKCCDLDDKSLMYYPSGKREVRSVITQYLEEIGQEGLIAKYNLEKFEVNCIDPRKTICDKISRLVKLSYDEESVNLIAKHIRDVYDLCALYNQEELKAFLFSGEFKDAMYKVTIEDGFHTSSKSHLNLADAIIFKTPKDIIDKPQVLSAYNEGLKILIFAGAELPATESVVSILSSYHAVLLGFEEYRLKTLKQEIP
jgi:hypothetical protein